MYAHRKRAPSKRCFMLFCIAVSVLLEDTDGRLGGVASGSSSLAGEDERSVSTTGLSLTFFLGGREWLESVEALRA